MILAAGRGERMGALTDALPKPLLRVGPETLIERQLRQVAACGIDEVVINLSYRGEQIRAALGDGSRFGVRVAYSQEPEPPLETGGGIVEALPLLGRGPFLLVNADVVCDFELGALGPPRGHGTLVLVPNPAHHPAGDCGLAADGRLVAAAPRLTFAGISLLDTALFAGLGRGRRSLKSVLDAAIAKGDVYGLVHSGAWLDVGTPERLAAARALLAQSA
jgi:MurNAc alpha-1-phosphate uridylyltransferase